MNRRRPLTEAELKTMLTSLVGWSIENGKLTKQYRFKSFAQAMGWMMTAAIEIDKMDHHPEWFNVYNRVSVQLVTHDAGNKITELDMKLAAKLDSLV